MRRFRNKHAGERCFICGNGPSMNRLNLSWLKDEVTFGCNGVFNYPALVPRYYACEAPSMSKEQPNDIIAYEGPEWKFLSERYRYYFPAADNVIWTPYDYDNDWLEAPRFSWDCALQVCNGKSIMYSLIQIAVYMGCNPVYLLGLDFDYPDGKDAKPTHAYETEHKAYDVTDKTMQRNAFKHAADVLGGQLFNATPRTQLDVIPKVDYESLFDQHADPDGGTAE